MRHINARRGNLELAGIRQRLANALPAPVLAVLRGARGFAERIRFRPYVTDIRLLDHPFRFLIADPWARAWYTPRAQNANPHLRWLVEQMLAPGDVVLQCGAHHGLATLAMARRVGPEGAVYCVEPHARNAAVIARNAALNGLTNVHTVVRAIGGHTGAIGLTHGSHTSAPVPGARGVPTFAARASTLDDLVDELGIRPDLVVLDIGGLEVTAIGASPRLVARGPRWAIEVHPEDLRLRGQGAADLLPALGQRRFVQAADGRGGPVRPLSDGALPPCQHEIYAWPDRMTPQPGSGLGAHDPPG